MARYTVYVDGASGTTGLQIRERLEGQPDIEFIIPEGDRRKELSCRLEALGQADLGILCLPDEAARELVSAAPAGARIIDASTAHRTCHDWVYGFAELEVPGPDGGRRRDLIRTARRVAVPGCHATGFLALAAPLLRRGLIPSSTRLHCHSLTGYSGGGKTMIAAYRDPGRSGEYLSPRQYGLALRHKHLPEMRIIAGLDKAPLFSPIVGDFYQGMLVSVGLWAEDFSGGEFGPGPAISIEKLRRFFADYYRGQTLVHVMEDDPPPYLASNTLAGRDDLEIWIGGGEEQVLLMARLDNLGKGASGAAVQCLNLMLGRPEYSGLRFEMPSRT
ncbi:MAG: N-acetyl-gamma-glutamyl-phosphate reductase [Treponema sp.]|jgi:N-acetyl-gamma-glutamyl-phosphate reductase|nr:N-acetyl-gamma-glutamyl-phosphate reductase [Treponema sp.]